MLNFSSLKKKSEEIKKWSITKEKPFYYFLDYERAWQLSNDELSEDQKKVLFFKHWDSYYINLVAEELIRFIKSNFKDRENFVLVCVPASKIADNILRYEDFSNYVCHELWIENGFNHIKILKEKAEKHKWNYSESFSDNIEIDWEFFKDKYVIIFDDVITKWETMNEMWNLLSWDEVQAKPFLAVTIGKTVRYTDTDPLLSNDDNPYIWEKRKKVKLMKKNLNVKKSKTNVGNRIKLFFFDTETTWANPQQDQIIQFWWIYWIYDSTTGKFEEISRINQLIKPSIEISEWASKVHWLYKKDLEKYELIGEYIYDFLSFINKADFVVWHNVEFDKSILIAETKRLGISFDFSKVRWVDTMKTTSALLKIPAPERSKDKYKWPKLSELYRFLFKKDFDNAHDAMADITATKDCLLELCKRYDFYNNWEFRKSLDSDVMLVQFAVNEILKEQKKVKNSKYVKCVYATETCEIEYNINGKNYGENEIRNIDGYIFPKEFVVNFRSEILIKSWIYSYKPEDIKCINESWIYLYKPEYIEGINEYGWVPKKWTKPFAAKIIGNKNYESCIEIFVSESTIWTTIDNKYYEPDELIVLWRWLYPKEKIIIFWWEYCYIYDKKLYHYKLVTLKNWVYVPINWIKPLGIWSPDDGKYINYLLSKDASKWVPIDSICEPYLPSSDTGKTLQENSKWHRQKLKGQWEQRKSELSRDDIKDKLSSIFAIFWIILTIVFFIVAIVSDILH